TDGTINGGTWVGTNPTIGAAFQIGTKSNHPIGFFVNDSGSAQMTILQSGKVGIGTMAPSEMLEVDGNVKATAFLYTSDARLKKDILEIEDPLAKIMELRGVNFTWKLDGRRTMGFIAQEVEEVIPEVVHTDKSSE